MRIEGNIECAGQFKLGEEYFSPDSFYGIAIAQTGGIAYKGINKVNFETQWFYVNQNNPNTDEVIVNFRGITAGSGEANTASNLGAGSGIFAQKVGVDLQLKSLVAGTNISLTPSGTEISIASTGGSGGDPGFYGISVGMVNFPAYKNINTVKFDNSDFYIDQNSINRDEVIVHSKFPGLDFGTTRGIPKTRSVKAVDFGSDNFYIKFKNAANSKAIIDLRAPYFNPVRELSPTVVDVVNSSTITTIYTFTVPANSMGPNGAVNLRLLGDFLSNSGTPTITLTVNFGGSTIFADATGTHAAATQRAPWKIDLVLNNLGNVNSQVLTGTFTRGNRAAATTGIGDLAVAGIVGAVGGTSAINTTVNQDLVVRITWNVANAAISFRKLYGIAEILKT